MEQLSPKRRSYKLFAYYLILLTLLQFSANAQNLTGFTLLNSRTNTELGALQNGSIINLSVTGNLLNVQANVNSSAVTQVVFDLDGNADFRTEKEPPYTLAGDKEGDPHDWSPSLGVHTLKATPYNADGEAGTPLVVTFTVVASTSTGEDKPDADGLTGFTLIDASTSTDLLQLKNGEVIDLTKTGTLLNVRANTNSSRISKVVFALDDNENFRTETVAPYTLAGDTDQGHYDWTPSLGPHTLKATPYGPAGEVGTPLTVNFTVIASTPDNNALTGFTLISASTNTDLGPLQNGTQIDLRLTGEMLNIRANTNSSTISKVVFALDGNENFRTETVAPYTLAGDTDQGHYDWTPSLGPHTLKATPYNASGEAGTPLTVTFTVISSDSPQEEPGDNHTPANVVVQGELRKWHKITLAIEGPESSETAAENPFLNYRLNVTFTKGSKRYVVPGYFAADGNASQTSASSGNIWKVHFSPDETGVWNYTISMRKGTNIAVSDDANAGNAVELVDGKSGRFTVQATNKTGIDLRAKGRLKYVGERYMQFAETGEYFIKGGVDSPENFLSYADFDNSTNIGNRRKTWGPHVKDWKEGDPTWQGGKGKGIIGAVNYLASQQMNVFSFITMGVNGDDRNVYPYVSPNDFSRFDCSKLDQWETVFEHGEKLGMYLHFKTQERENCTLLDGGNVGTQRKLYYRELIARFGHHLALNWNMGEENIQTTQQRKDMAQYFYEHDPYKNHIVIHTNVKQQGEVYTPLLGNKADYTGVSIQTDWNNVYKETLEWVEKSTKAGKKWIVANDEQNSVGVACDADYRGNRGIIPDNQDQIRKECLWGNLMAGGAGIEYYFGGHTGETDLAAEDYRSRAKMYRFTRYAMDFFRSYVPLKDVVPMNNSNRGWVLGQEGKMYVLYLKDGGTAHINTGGGTYTVQWYDPRNGGSLQDGTVRTISGKGSKSIGFPPNSFLLQDWVVLIKSEAYESDEPEQPATSVYRINAGGEAYTTSDGKVFSADSYVNGGDVYSSFVGEDIKNTVDDDLYKKERYGNFSYNLPVANGTYQVILHFAEVYARGAGQRKFNVDIEGERKLTEFDVFTKAGGDFSAIRETFTTTVRDGMLNINFSRGSANNAKVSAIEVVGVGATTARLSSGMSAETAGLQITSYPNPFNESFTIRVKGRGEGPLPVVIYDTYGRVVQQLADIQTEQVIHLGKGYVPGLYILQVGEGVGARQYKLMKH
ncbi:malectin domain-containing carbohydrate-binding protein [Larkinella arboricola]